MKLRKNESITNDFDRNYLICQHKIAKQHKWIQRFVNKIEISGLDNLKQLNNQHFIGFSNHKSHFDYVALGYIFLNYLHVNDFPRIVAGSNLDSRILSTIGLNFRKMGGFFVNREKIQRQNRKQKINYLEKIDSVFKDSLKQKENFWIFPEGGRAYSNEVMKKTKYGLIRSLAESEQDPLIITTAINYDKIIEEPYFSILNWAKINFRFLYYSIDGFAFASRPFLRKNRGNIYISFGKTKRLSEIVSSSNSKQRTRQLAKYLETDVISLHNEII